MPSLSAAVPPGCTPALKLAQAGFSVALFEEHHGVGEPVHCTGVLAREAFEEFGLSTGIHPQRAFHRQVLRALRRPRRVLHAIGRGGRHRPGAVRSIPRAEGRRRRRPDVLGQRVTSVDVDQDGVRVTAGGAAVARGARVRARVRRQLRAAAQARARHAAPAAAFGAGRAAGRAARRCGSAFRPAYRAAGLRLGGAGAARAAVRPHRRDVRSRRRPSLQRHRRPACAALGDLLVGSPAAAAEDPAARTDRAHLRRPRAGARRCRRAS